jgi:hypothetical protein
MTTNAITTGPASAAKLDLYLDRLAARTSAPGWLIFALDATASREATWDAAASLTAAMFTAVTALNIRLNIQLTHYRGVDECRAWNWTSDARVLTNYMSKVRCSAGATQLGKILTHARKENAKQKIAALVFVGDSCEENPDTLCAKARELPCPMFLFQEGDHPEVAEVFGMIAKVTGGVHCQFDQGSAQQLAELLGAVAVYAAGGMKALKDMSSNAGAVRLLQHLKS